MAKSGRVFLFGNGEVKVNPIHGEDLAEVCVDAIENSDKEVNIGGPDVLTQNEMAVIAFEVLGKETKITCLPDWLRIAIRKILRTFTGSKFYGPIEFFLTVMAIDLIAPQYGKKYCESVLCRVERRGAFDPPAPITFPNFDCLTPGMQVELYSFDHDLEGFVVIGLGTVSEDSSVIKSNSGVGIIKAGWT